MIDLTIFEGDWAMEVSNAAFLPDRETKMQGHASFDWIEQHAFLVLRQRTAGDENHWANWFIGRDNDLPGYTVFYMDDRNISRIYQMSLEDRVWKIWRDSPGFCQRFSAQLSDDGQLISGAWEHSADGEEWHHDFNLAYKRK